MSSINYLVPGYVHQEFSLFRGELCEKGYKLTQSCGKGSLFFFSSIVLLSKISEFVEIPFKFIEDIAFTIINLIGTLFNKNCQEHLKECGWQLLVDMNYVGFVAVTVGLVALIILASSIQLPLLGRLGCFLYGAAEGLGLGVIGSSFFLEIFSAEKSADYHRISWYRIQAIREHGYKTVALKEKEIYPQERGSTFRKIFFYFYNPLKNPEQAINFYKNKAYHVIESEGLTIHMHCNVFPNKNLPLNI